MPKPKPPPLEVVACQQAEKELPQLQQQLQKSLANDGDDNGSEMKEMDNQGGENEEEKDLKDEGQKKGKAI